MDLESSGPLIWHDQQTGSYELVEVESLTDDQVIYYAARFKWAIENNQFEHLSQEEGDSFLTRGAIGTFPQGVRRDVVTQVLRNKKPLSDLTQQERELAAKWYENQVAPNVGQKFQDAARQFNQARANPNFSSALWQKPLLMVKVSLL
jgi:hypothetical protein